MTAEAPAAPAVCLPHRRRGPSPSSVPDWALPDDSAPTRWHGWPWASGGAREQWIGLWCDFPPTNVVEADLAKAIATARSVAKRQPVGVAVCVQ
jgi:hypothetical protein